MLELHDVTGAYGSILGVKGLSFSVDNGATVAIIGRNGAGKSTTLRLISGVIQPVVGDITWEGKSLKGSLPEQRARRGITLVPEGRGIFAGLTVEENLRIGAYCRHPGRRQLAASLDYVYSVVPILGQRRRQLGGSLSGGEQQLLAVGRGLMNEPQLLMLDEPSLGLSPIMTSTLYDLLHEVKKDGVAMVIVEQYVQFVLELCDMVVGLSKGECVFAGSTPELLSSGLLGSLYMGGEEVVESEMEEEIRHELHM
jgi:branched-chain amino acid transport system ATP-binding protein